MTEDLLGPKHPLLPCVQLVPSLFQHAIIVKTSSTPLHPRVKPLLAIPIHIDTWQSTRSVSLTLIAIALDESRVLPPFTTVRLYQGPCRSSSTLCDLYPFRGEGAQCRRSRHSSRGTGVPSRRGP
ncbi:hypothetical protein NDA11_003425 [Ustilago hordei]|nr:hypothetical protein NDA11_003425 [Ustilago hordei]